MVAYGRIGAGPSSRRIRSRQPLRPLSASTAALSMLQMALSMRAISLRTESDGHGMPERDRRRGPPCPVPENCPRPVECHAGTPDPDHLDRPDVLLNQLLQALHERNECRGGRGGAGHEEVDGRTGDERAPSKQPAISASAGSPSPCTRVAGSRSAQPVEGSGLVQCRHEPPTPDPTDSRSSLTKNRLRSPSAGRKLD